MNKSIDRVPPVARYANEAKLYIMLLHKSFAIQMKKLDAAHEDGIITDEEYNQWSEFFDTSRKEWLTKDFTKPENISLLSVMAKHNMDIARKLNFTPPLYTTIYLLILNINNVVHGH